MRDPSRAEVESPACAVDMRWHCLVGISSFLGSRGDLVSLTGAKFSVDL